MSSDDEGHAAGEGHCPPDTCRTAVSRPTRMNFARLKSQLQANLTTVRQRISGAPLCSDCFIDHGLGIEARKIGRKSRRPCRNCHSVAGAKLYHNNIEELARRFFVYGSWIRTEFGGASALQFNSWHHDKREVSFPASLKPDARLVEDALGVGFFHYGPPLWRIGEIEPLHELRNPTSQTAAAALLVRRFPRRQFPTGSCFYRLRREIREGKRSEPSEYDAPEWEARRA